jgi:pimeloyl-ACP methyl ester carboxylesterase
MLKIVRCTLLALLLLLLLGSGLWLALRAPDLPAQLLEQRDVDSRDHFLELAPGYRIHYREQGPPQAPVLLLVHGYSDSYATWQGWMEALAPRFRVISLDLPGHGLTAAPSDFVLDADALAELLLQLIDRLQLPPLVLAGNSMGGGVAWKFALAHPERLRALVLVAAVGLDTGESTGQSGLIFRLLQQGWARQLLATLDTRALLRQALRAQVHDARLITEQVVAQWADYLRYPGHRPILLSAWSRPPLQASPSQLATLSMPTLILQGESDPVIAPAASRRLAQAIPGAKLLLYPQVGHLPQREIALRSARDVADFMHTLPAERAAGSAP